MEKTWNEIEYQQPIWAHLLTKKTFNTTSSSTITVINNGKLNPYEGPDLKNLCLISGSHLKICDAEIDLKSSNWYSHYHHSNPTFKKVQLHIVFEDNSKTGIETIVINPNDLLISNKNDLLKLNQLELEEYSLIRLKRKSALHSEYLKAGFRYAWTKSLLDFINSIKKKRIRPKSLLALDKLFQSRFTHKYYIFLLSKSASNISANELFQLHSKRFYLSSEIFINCLLPMALAMNPTSSHVVFSVWWSLPSSNNYGILKNRFPYFSQEYIWQQQGMKEFLLQNNEKRHLLK